MVALENRDDDKQPVVAVDPVESAKAAGLRYITDRKPGITRRRSGKGFVYVGLDGKLIKDGAELARIKALAIPPAWQNVWICPSPRGHIQATGIDARGRKQYRYHPRWREVRDETKYTRMIAFGEALPGIRERVELDMALPGLPREKVLATIVRLLETTFIRVGNEQYARENKSFGLTTLRTRHVNVEGSEIEFKFRGKSGIKHEIAVKDRRLARVVKRIHDLPGQELFQYMEGGERRTVDSSDVNEYLQEISGQDFTAKDFRTWAGTILASLALQEIGYAEKATQMKKNVVQAIKQVAEQLGNTPAVCRKCYVHPAVLEAYMEGSLAAGLQAVSEVVEEGQALEAPPDHGLRPEERDVLRFLKQRSITDAKTV